VAITNKTKRGVFIELFACLNECKKCSFWNLLQISEYFRQFF
jgi:hypothetical protein